jgi:hypothetical protein
MATGSFIDTLAPYIEILESLAVAGAAVVAMWGITAWRREHIGRKRIDTAEEILELFYFAKDAISSIRSPGGYSGEGKTRKRDADEDDETTERLNNAFVTIERMLSYKEQFAKLQTLQYRAVAYWGESAKEPFDTFNAIIHELQSAAHMLGIYAKSPSIGRRDEVDLREFQSVIYRGFRDDKISPMSDTMLEQAKQLCRPIIGTTLRQRGPN